MMSILYLLLLSSPLTMASSSKREECFGYVHLDFRINAGREDCKEIRDSIEEAESGCALREMLNGTDAYFVCIFSQRYFRWLDENNLAFDFDVVARELEAIQIDDELEHVAEETESLSVPFPEDQLEVATAALLAPGAEIEGEQDDCWYDGEAGRELRLVADFFTLFRAIRANTPSQCQTIQPFHQ